MAFAVEAAAKGDEDKVFTALRRLQEEDPTIDLHRDDQTGEQIVAGLSQVHVEVIVGRLKERFGAEVTLKPPRVPYRETIKGKRQGARPLQEADRRPRPVRRLPHRDRAATGRQGFEFENAIKGGVIPTGFIPAVQKGIEEAMARGRRGRLPVEGREGAALRWLLPLGRLVRDGVQGRRLDGVQAGGGAGPAGAARADHEGHGVGARGACGRRDRRPQLAPRAAARHGAEGRR